jgi:protocatechuate 3,4-dioxygenase beta subunit
MRTLYLYPGLKSILKGAPIMIKRKGLLLATMTALLVSAVALGQTTTATLSGVVKDASGALVPDVKITARNAATGATRDTRTDSEGRYSLTNLGPGAQGSRRRRKAAWF